MVVSVPVANGSGRDQGGHHMALPLFNPGRVGITPAALELTQNCGMNSHVFLQRHLAGDWAEMTLEDQRQNTQALETGDTRIFSAYILPNQCQLWIITEADRSSTTIL